jgi:hypothetical protein
LMKSELEKNQSEYMSTINESKDFNADCKWCFDFSKIESGN